MTLATLARLSLVVAAAIVACGPDPARAQTRQPTVSLRVDAPSTPVTEGDSFQLDVVVSLRTQDPVEELALPDMPSGLTVLQERRSSSTQISAVNGQRQVLVEHRYMYLLRADEPGTFVIPSATARAGGVSGRSAPVTLRVLSDGSHKDDNHAVEHEDGATGLAPTAPGARFGRSPPAAFLEVTLDRNSAWVGQQITATTEVYTQQPLAQWPRMPALKPAGFFCTSLLDENRPSPAQRTIAGRTYYVYLVNKDALFPLAPGDKTIPAQQVDLVPAGSLFSRPRDITARSAPVAVNILALPDDNKPPGFSPGNVGMWQLEANVRPQTAALGEPVTLTIIATGTGSLEQLELPTWDGGGQARVFPASVRREPRPVDLADPELGGRVVVELLVQPQHEGQLRIPSLGLATFDPVAGTYRNTRTTPLLVTVTPARSAGGAPAQAGTQQVIARGTRPLKRQVDATVSVGDQPVWAAAGLCGLGALAWGAGNARRRRQASVEGQREARRRERTRAIDDAVGRGDLAALERVVLDALAERFGDGVKSCATAELPGLLAARGVARADVDAVVRFIQDVEAARYARGSATAEERRILGDAARGLLDRTEHAAHHGPQEVAS